VSYDAHKLVEVELLTYSDDAHLEEVELERQESVTGFAVRVDHARTAPRGRTISIKRLSKRELERGRLENPDVDVSRPRTRGECMQGEHAERPCPFVSCKHHLYLDVSPRSGAIKMNFPHLEVWELPESCALDVAAEGGKTLEELAEIVNLTRERIRQVETQGLTKIKALSDLAGLAEHCEEGVFRPDLHDEEGVYDAASIDRAADKIVPPVTTQERYAKSAFRKGRRKHYYYVPAELRTALLSLLATTSTQKAAALLGLTWKTIQRVVRNEGTVAVTTLRALEESAVLEQYRARKAA
jgi:hypothetical protein